MTKSDQYLAAYREIEIRLEKGGDLIADLGNITAILKKRLGYFWIGFYFVRDNRLVLGPFQGTPACVYLEIGKGVCGTCAEKKETILVPDVNKFPGHVACDVNSQSEIVIPVYDQEGELRAVFDLDHNVPDAFDDVDREWLEKIVKIIQKLW